MVSATFMLTIPPERICSRAKPVFEGLLAPVSYLPFECQVFRELVKRFYIHPTITRTIGREITYFSTQYHRNCGIEGSKIS
jgi:hypothetical protein